MLSTGKVLQSGSEKLCANLHGKVRRLMGAMAAVQGHI